MATNMSIKTDKPIAIIELANKTRLQLLNYKLQVKIHKHNYNNLINI